MWGGVPLGNGGHGTSVKKVVLETPVSVISGWNAEMATTMVDLPPNFCCARLKRTTTGGGLESDFRACALDKADFGETQITNPFCIYSKTIHQDTSKVKKPRMVDNDPITTYAILCLVSSLKTNQWLRFIHTRYICSDMYYFAGLVYSSAMGVNRNGGKVAYMRPTFNELRARYNRIANNTYQHTFETAVESPFQGLQ